MEIQILNDTNVIGDFREFSERIDSLAKYEISELLNICNEICSLLLQIDDHGLEKFIKYWIKNFERCDQIVNILTYILVTVLIYLCRGNVTRTVKKLTLLFSIIIVSIIYYAIGVDVKLIVNTSILAPVSWTWIIKPILSKFGYDYKNIDNKIN